LEKACAIFSEKYGETADECGESYFYYGSALLELAKLDHESLEPQESNGDLLDEGNLEESKTDAETKDAEPVTDVDMEKDEATEAEEANEAEALAEEEVSNLQLAWEILELAKTIYYRKSKTCKDMEMQLSDIYQKLGEVSLESENFVQSIEEFCQCLFLRQKNMTPDDRKIAEIHYQLGNAYTFDKQYMKGKVQYDLSLKVLNKRMVKLTEAMAEIKDGKACEEGEEIENIFQDIAQKVANVEKLEKEVKTTTATLSPRLEKAIRKTGRTVSSLAMEASDNAQAKILEFGEGSMETEETSVPTKASPVKPAATEASTDKPAAPVEPAATLADKPAAKETTPIVKRKRDSLDCEDSISTSEAVVTKSPTVKKVKVAEVAIEEPVLTKESAKVATEPEAVKKVDAEAVKKVDAEAVKKVDAEAVKKVDAEAVKKVDAEGVKKVEAVEMEQQESTKAETEEKVAVVKEVEEMETEKAPKESAAVEKVKEVEEMVIVKEKAVTCGEEQSAKSEKAAVKKAKATEELAVEKMESEEPVSSKKVEDSVQKEAAAITTRSTRSRSMRLSRDAGASKDTMDCEEPTKAESVSAEKKVEVIEKPQVTTEVKKVEVEVKEKETATETKKKVEVEKPAAPTVKKVVADEPVLANGTCNGEETPKAKVEEKQVLTNGTTNGEKESPKEVAPAPTVKKVKVADKPVLSNGTTVNGES